MPDAPFISTFIAIGLLPVAFLFIHAFLSGLKGWRFHRLTGLLAIVWDLSMSIGYMLFRAFGGEVEGSTLELTGGILAYFIVHGIMAVIVITLEFVVLYTGWAASKERPNLWKHSWMLGQSRPARPPAAVGFTTQYSRSSTGLPPLDAAPDEAILAYL